MDSPQSRLPREKPPVGVVIVNHNLKDSLRETLESFQKVRYPSVKVVVSDNASTDGSREMVRQLFPEVDLLAHDPEVGYARAASLGMAHLADTTKYIFSTTNDVLVDPEMLDVLVEFAEKNPKAGVLGAKIYFFDRPQVLWSAGGRIQSLFGFPYHFGWNRKDGPRYNEVRECDFVTGCGFLLRSDVLKQVNFMNPELIFYAEDSDLCYKIKEQGYRVFYLPEARMWHKTDTTIAKNRSVQLQYSTRNSLYLLQRHRIGYHPLTLWLYLAVVCPVKMAAFGLMLRWKNIAGIYRGARDWYRGQDGWITT